MKLGKGVNDAYPDVLTFHCRKLSFYNPSYLIKKEELKRTAKMLNLCNETFPER